MAEYSILSRKEDWLIYKIATPARRLGGYFLDAILSFVFLVITISIFDNPATSIILLPLLWIFFWTNGTTPGKRILNMKVIDKDTKLTAGLGTMLLREIIGKAISHLIACLGFIWILIDDNHQGWHDKLVNTIVVVKY